MSEQSFRVRVKVGQVELEVEGAEGFVKEAFDYTKQEILGKIEFGVEAIKGIEVKPTEEGKEIPIKEKPPEDLRAFVVGKQPRNNQELVTVFAYYLKHRRDTPEFTEDNIVACWRETGRVGKLEMPGNVMQQIRNAARRRVGYLERVRRKQGTYTITGSGEYLVEHTLPRTRESK